MKKPEASNAGQKVRQGGAAEFHEPKRLPPGKVSFADIGLDEALSRAEGAIAVFEEAFLYTAREDIRRLLALVQSGGAGPDQGPALKPIRTIALHLREHGGMFDYPLVTNVAKSLLDFTEGSSSLAAEDLELLAVHANSLRLLIEEQVKGHDSARGKEIVDRLERAVSRYQAAKGDKRQNSALIIDDDPDLADFTRIVLAELGLKVSVEENYESALKNFPAMDWSVVIADIFMGGMGGIEGIKRIREASPGVKILAISAGHGQMNQGSTLMAATKIGADAVLAKPFDVEALTKAVLPFLGK